MLDVSDFLLLLDFRARFSPSVAAVYDRRNTVTIHHLRSPGPSRFREMAKKCSQLNANFRLYLVRPAKDHVPRFRVN